MHKRIEPRHAYNYDADQVSLETALACKDPSKAVQSQKSETDINEIVRRFAQTGQLPMPTHLPTNADFDQVLDFQTAMNTIRAAQESFQALPAPVRERFGNDPAEFVNFCSTEGNEAELRKLGLLPPEPPKEEPLEKSST